MILALPFLFLTSLLGLAFAFATFFLAEAQTYKMLIRIYCSLLLGLYCAFFFFYIINTQT